MSANISEVNGRFHFMDTAKHCRVTEGRWMKLVMTGFAPAMNRILMRTSCTSSVGSTSDASDHQQLIRFIEGPDNPTGEKALPRLPFLCTSQPQQGHGSSVEAKAVRAYARNTPVFVTAFRRRNTERLQNLFRRSRKRTYYPHHSADRPEVYHCQVRHHPI